jgi:hypothetical protein
MWVVGTVCVTCLTEKVERKKNEVGLAGLEVLTAGWVNFVCI